MGGGATSVAARGPLRLGNAAISIALAAAWMWADKPTQAATRAAAERHVRGGNSASGERDGHSGIGPRPSLMPQHCLEHSPHEVAVGPVGPVALS